MIDRRAQRDSSISIFRIIAVACAICVLVYFIFALVTGIEPIVAMPAGGIEPAAASRPAADVTERSVVLEL